MGDLSSRSKERTQRILEEALATAQYSDLTLEREVTLFFWLLQVTIFLPPKQKGTEAKGRVLITMITDVTRVEVSFNA